MSDNFFSILWSEHASLRVICRNDMIQCIVLRDLNWRPPVQRQSSPVQVKEPYTGFILMHVGSSCKHTEVYKVHLPRIIRYCYFFFIIFFFTVYRVDQFLTITSVAEEMRLAQGHNERHPG